jgi:hypothetical protein
MKRGWVAWFLVASCATASSTEGDGRVKVVNASSSSLVVFAVPNAHLVDPVPVLEPGSFSNQQIAPGAGARISLGESYSPGEPLALLIYTVRDSGAVLTDWRWLTPAALVKDRTIVLGESPSLSDGHPAE